MLCYLRLDFLSSFEFVGNLLGKYLVEHIACRHLCPETCISLLDNRLGIIRIHVSENQVKVLGFRAEERVTTPALLHDFGHPLWASAWNLWPVVDPWIANLAKYLSRMFSLVRNLAAIDLEHDHAFV
jgi:hypothetical protein